MDPAFPDVTADLEGWRLADESVETLFQVPGARVHGATRRFEDERTRAAVREATGGTLDREWRFVAATGLGFEPPLPSGTTPMVMPLVRREAREAFARRLSERGLANVRRRGEERVRVHDGTGVRLTRYAADDHANGTVPVAGWVGVRHGDDISVVTGGHPDCRLADALDLEDPPVAAERTAAEYREEFLAALRSVR
jgi:hypothetical protein